MAVLFSMLGVRSSSVHFLLPHFQLTFYPGMSECEVSGDVRYAGQCRVMSLWDF